MARFTKFIKNLRPEYKVVLTFFIILILYTLYSLFFKEMVSNFSSSSSVSTGVEVKGKRESSIEDAVSANRPIVIAPNAMQGHLNSMSSQNREIKGMELATEVDNPTVWIYVANDGERKDDLAERSCRWLHENGIPASSVMILDEAARSKGKLIEIGESKCM